MFHKLWSNPQWPRLLRSRPRQSRLFQSSLLRPSQQHLRLPQPKQPHPPSLFQLSLRLLRSQWLSLPRLLLLRLQLQRQWPQLQRPWSQFLHNLLLLQLQSLPCRQLQLH